MGQLWHLGPTLGIRGAAHEGPGQGHSARALPGQQLTPRPFYAEAQLILPSYGFPSASAGWLGVGSHSDREMITESVIAPRKACKTTRLTRARTNYAIVTSVGHNVCSGWRASLLRLLDGHATRGDLSTPPARDYINISFQGYIRKHLPAPWETPHPSHRYLRCQGPSQSSARAT